MSLWIGVVVIWLEVRRRAVQPEHSVFLSGFAMQLYVIHLGCQPFSGLSREDGSNHRLQHRKTSRCSASWHEGLSEMQARPPTHATASISLPLHPHRCKCSVSLSLSLLRWPRCVICKPDHERDPRGMKWTARGNRLGATNRLPPSTESFVWTGKNNKHASEKPL